MPLLEARDVGMTYDGAHWVLRDLSLAIEKGDLVLVKGRSGSGKSTLFHLLAGLDRPTTGSILLDGADLATLPERDVTRMRLHRMGLVFQSFNLLPDLSGFHNVLLPMRIARRTGREARARELLALLRIEHLAEKLPSEMSGGEQQRVAIARALANEPAILLADEPTGNLDEENARNVLSAFARVNADLGTAVLVISHDPLASEFVPRRVDLKDGRLVGRAEAADADAAAA
ncbi:MAG: ABC transporter ATP-binding protein [Methanobacteriota archaeon]